MGLLLFSIDDDLDTDLDTPIWDGAFRDVVRYDALAREIEHCVARATEDTVVPPCIGSLVLLAGSLRRLSAGAANGTYRELFAPEGIVGAYLVTTYAAAREQTRTTFDAAIAAQNRLEAVTDELPEEVRGPVLEAFVAFSRFRNDLA